MSSGINFAPLPPPQFYLGGSNSLQFSKGFFSVSRGDYGSLMREKYKEEEEEDARMYVITTRASVNKISGAWWW